MRVTNERAQFYKELCPKDNGKQVNCYGCHYNEERYETCPSSWGSSLLAADLLEARELIKEMREELREVLVAREHGEAKEMVFITNFAEIEAILERTKEYQ